MKQIIRFVAMMLMVALLTACGGGGGSNNSGTMPVDVSGEGVKGPLAGAIVRLYSVDLSKTDLKGALLDEGSTGSNAAITGLSIEPGLSGLVLLEFVADAGTIDINTGIAPVIDHLTTVFDVQRIYDGDDLYATPLTTMAVSLAQANADKGPPYSGDTDDTITANEFTTALNTAQNQVKSTLGFGLDSSVDIFTDPPIITSQTNTTEAQTKVARYRQAIESVVALADKVANDSSASDTPQEVFDGLTEDLKDGTIDGSNDATPVATLAALDTPIDTTLGSLDPTTLTIPNTTTPVTDIEQVLVDEMATTEQSTDTTALTDNTIDIVPAAPVLVAESSDTYSVGGTVSGLSGSVVLQINSGDDLTLSTNGTFSFATPVTDGASYNVTVLNQPTEQICTASSNTGTVSGSSVTNVVVTCVTNTYSIGGNVTGLTGNVVLQNNNGDDLTVNANGAFTFSTPIAYGNSYNVSILTQPAGQTCTASTNTGTVNGANVTNVAVNCSTNTYTIGGSVSGLSGSVVLQNNGGDDITVSGSTFSFSPVVDGASYNVTVLTQPAGQTCTASTNTGTVNGANVTNVAVTCTTNTYTVGGTVSGLSGSVVLQNNGGDDITVSGSTFTFSPLADGSSYNVSVLTQPAGQLCSASSNTGTVSGANVTTVSVSCVSSYTIGGTISGLSGSIVLQNNGGDDLTVNADGAFTFSTAVTNSSNYSVAVSTQPTNLTCFVGSGSGQVSGADITNVSVFCSSPELDADVISDTVTLDWMDVGASSYNLYYSSESNCDIANYASCANGTLLTNVTPPLTVTDLAVEQNWWFQLESVVTGANGVAQVGVRTSQVSPQGTLGGLQGNVDHGFLSVITHDASGRTYLGGDFAAMANVSGRGVVASAARADGTATGHARAYPVIGGGVVYAAASDGNGGYYIGGTFTKADGQSRTRLAHILPSGELDPYWAPAADNTVYSIAVVGNIVYVGGYFSTIDGVSHPYLAAIDSDGNLQSWDPGLDAGVRAMQLSGTTLYIGGGFGSVGADARGKLAAIDTTTGNLTSWTPVTVNNGEVRGLVVYNGSVYFGGTFTQVDSTPRNYLAAVDSNGALTTWNPAPDQKVYSLAISGSTIYAGGYFTAIGGGTHYYLAAIDAVSGTVQNWPTNYSLSVAGSVRSLAAHGSTVYVGGDLRGFNGTEQKFAAAYGTDGSFYNWDVAVDDHVYALAADDDTVFVGGLFNLQGGVARSNLAALEADDSLDLNWAPAANDVVEALTVYGSTLYVGGSFTTIDDGNGAQTRNRLAAIGTTNGTLDANWAPLANGAVYALAADASGTVYAGGAFTNINDGTSYARSYLAAIDSSGFVVNGWAPAANNDVFAVTVSGSTVYVGGNFFEIDSIPRESVAAIGTNGNLSNWSPAVMGTVIYGDEVVSDILVSGSTVYIAGSFYSIDDGSGPVSIYNLAAVDDTNGSLSNWNPDPYGYIYDIALSGSTLYAAGEFPTIGGVNGTPRNYAAGINTGDGSATSLNPNLDAWAEAVDVHDGKVYFGGGFTTQDGTPSPLLTILPE